LILPAKTMGKAVRPCAHAPEFKFGRVQYRPQKSLDMLIEQFLASLRFEQRGKLDQLGIEIGSFD
jgi:hypothetical protein